jgi:CheY-like chemotaxis protein
MDLEMPLKNGYKTSREIRTLTEESKKNIPIIAMTAHVLDKVLDKCYENGINDCIAKPFQLDVLQKKIVSLTNIEPTTKEKTIDKAKYIGLYIKSFNNDFELLKTAISKYDSNEVKYLLHKMKGSALTMEFDDLATLFLQMEQKKLVALEKSLDEVKALFEKNSKINL